ncbi:MAG TPA: flippase [Methanosarcina sp.]|jgi:O-antigen/teichoic acid export membrane protein|nr:flippase [Methanosarcina sp.]
MKIKNLLNNKTITDINLSFLSLFSSAIVYFLLRVVLGNRLGASSLGVYTLIYTIYMFGLQFADFGIGAALTKHIAEKKEENITVIKLISSGFAGAIFSGLFLAILLFLISGYISINIYHNSEMELLLKITAICYPFMAIEKTVMGSLNGLREMKLFAYISIIQNISVFLITLAFVILLKMDLYGAILGFVIPTVAVGFLSLYLVKKFIKKEHIRFNDYLRKIVFFGLYVILIDSIGMINTQIDTLLIGYFMDETQVGYYTVSVIFVQVIILLPRAIQRITYPSISAYNGRKDFKNIRKLIRSTTTKTLLITSFLSVIIAAFGKITICLFFSSDFLPAYKPLLILLIGYSIFSPWVSIGTVFASIGKLETSFKTSIYCAIFNTISNILLIPKFGIIGAATATSASLIFTVIINLFFLKKYMYSEKSSQNLI